MPLGNSGQRDRAEREPSAPAHGEYVNYHHQDRTHDSLTKNTPPPRPMECKPAASMNVALLCGLRPRVSMVSGLIAGFLLAWVILGHLRQKTVAAAPRPCGGLFPLLYESRFVMLQDSSAHVRIRVSATHTFLMGRQNQLKLCSARQIIRCISECSGEPVADIS